MAMAVYGVAVLVAPIVGPTMGGYLTENYSWRWIFNINLPVGAVSLFLTSLLVADPPHLVRQRQQRRGLPRIDYFGLGLLALGLGALEIVYDRGQIDDWFNSRRITILILIAVFCLTAAVFWELYHPRPIVNLRLFGDRNFALSCLVVFCVFAALYGSNVLLPQMVQALFRYDAYKAGLILSPGGIVTMIGMPMWLHVGKRPSRAWAPSMLQPEWRCFRSGAIHQGSGSPRWKYPPVGPSSGRVASCTLDLPPSERASGAVGPPMSV
jgi:DHA2 family multidrug resistance protein